MATDTRYPCPVKWSPGRFPWVTSCVLQENDDHKEHVDKDGASPPKGEWYIETNGMFRKFVNGEEILALKLVIGVDRLPYLVCSLGHMNLSDGKMCSKKWSLAGPDSSMIILEARLHAQGIRS